MLAISYKTELVQVVLLDFVFFVCPETSLINTFIISIKLAVILLVFFGNVNSITNSCIMIRYVIC